MSFQNYSIIKSQDSVLQTHSVLRNTYFLLSLTLLFSSCTAVFSLVTHARPGFLLTLIGMFGLSYLTQYLRNSAMGLVAIFAFTGFMGYTLGPLLDQVLHAYINGRQIIFTSLGATGLIFLSLSGYVLTTRKNFSYMGGFLFIASWVVILAAVGSIFLNIPIFNLLVSGGIALISSAFIMYQTSEIIHGGEDNYVMATLSLFISIFNLFVSLLRILSSFAGNRD
jgi:modulator of FtsH protease